jgi:toxin ParE1/3/4
MEILLTTVARDDLEDIWKHIAQDSPDRADAFVAALLDLIALLSDNPALGRLRPELRAGLRSITFRNRVVFYEVAPTAVLVYRILHGAMDLDATTLGE